jgi:virulence factor
MNMITIAIIGTGGIAQKAYFPLLAVMPDVRVIAVHSHTKANADAAASRWRIPFATNELSAIITKKPDAALVISSTASHFEICKTLLENDIDVYCEKPLTDASVKSHALSKIAEKHNRILAVGFNRRYALLYRQAKEILGDKPIRMAQIQKHRTQASNPSLFEQYLDDTIHQIDLMRYYCGDVDPLQTSYHMQNDVLVSAASTVRLPSGGLGLLTICNHAGAWQESVTLHTEGMSVHIDAFQRLHVIKVDHTQVYGDDRAGKWIPSLEERGFFGEVDHFLQCVKTRQQPMTSAEEAAQTQELVEALVRFSGDKLPF